MTAMEADAAVSPLRAQVMHQEELLTTAKRMLVEAQRHLEFCMANKRAREEQLEAAWAALRRVSDSYGVKVPTRAELRPEGIW